MAAKFSHSKEQLSDAIVKSYNANDLKAALSTCQYLNLHYDDYHYGWYLASFLMRKVRNISDAVTAINKALSISSVDSYLLHKAQCLTDLGETKQALSVASRLLDSSFTQAHMANELGELLYRLGNQEDAVGQFSKAVMLEPGNAQFQFNLAEVQRYIGDIAGSYKSYTTAIESNPQECEAYLKRAQLQIHSAEYNHVEDMELALGAVKDPLNRSKLHYALAKELEDMDETEKSFEHLRRAANTRRGQLQYDVKTDLQIIDSIKGAYGPELFDGRIQGDDQDGPIFVLGMPRTGTTLVERILASHPNVFSVGEINDFSQALMELTKQTVNPASSSRADFVAATVGIDFSALGKTYMSSTRRLRDGSRFFIDKLPFNYLYAGLINLALPNARIINVQRHPMDTCYSVYKQYFQDAYPFSYDLEELGRYYLAYRELMEHWNKVMPGVIHTVNYEDMVSDTEAEVQGLLNYCGLPWEDACLRFYENKSASTTASAVQVRQDVYRGSVEKWRCYEQQLQPLVSLFRDSGIIL